MSARDLLHTAAWAFAYALAVVVGRLTALDASGFALFWPAAGVAALWMLRASPASLPLGVAVLFSTTVVTNQLVGVTLAPALLFALANVTVGVVTRLVASRIEPHAARDLASTRGVIALAAAAAAAGLASAPWGALAGLLMGGTWTPLSSLAWVVRNATGVFVVAGTLLAVLAARRTRVPGAPWTCCLSHAPRPRVALELGATALGSSLVLALVFGPGRTLPVSYVVLAVSALIGFRFAPVVSAVHSLALATVSIASTLTGHGPLGDLGDPLVAAMTVQAWVLVQSAIALSLSWAVSERQQLAHDLEQARAHASERAQLLDAVTESLAHGVAVLDDAGRVLVRNGAAARLMPGPSERVTPDDQPAAYGITTADGSAVSPAEMPHVTALAEGVPVEADLAVTDPAGTATIVHVRAEPLEITGERPHRVAVVSLQDVTAHRSQVAQLESFAGVVAHDLQNPLAAVTAWAQVLEEHLAEREVLEPETAELLERINRAGLGMSDLISDLLAYASAAHAPLSPTDIDLDQLVAALAGELRAASTRPPLVSHRSLGSLHADPLLVRQVLANLLGNAVKYTPEGVRPHISLARSTVAGVTEIRITDNGIGIPEEMRTRVFDGFTRVPGTATTHPGTGLGLAICARAVERHGGTIAAGPNSRGRGTTITLRFPQPSGTDLPQDPSPLAAVRHP